MPRRIVCIACAVSLLLASAAGRTGYIIFSKRYTVSSGYNSYSLTVSRISQTVYDKNKKKLNNNKNTLVAVIKPNEKCLAELELLFDKNEIRKIKKELEKGYPVLKQTDVYADCKYIKLIDTVSSDKNQIADLVSKSYNDTVEEKKINFAVDAKGRFLDGDNETLNDYVDPNAAAGVIVSVDSRIQKIAEEAAKNMKKGAVVVMDPSTSEILALYSAGNDGLNRALMQYSVGSAFKIIVASCAEEYGITLDYTCTGKITVGDTEFSCQNEKAHGEQNIKTALANSCNCYFVKLALTLGADKLLKTARDFGFGINYSLMKNYDLLSGNLPSDNDLKSSGQLALFGFGQGKLTASPLSFCTALCAVANGGSFKQPQFILGEIDGAGNYLPAQTAPQREIISRGTSKTVLSYMRYVVESGTGRTADCKKLSAGKTSTAQSGRYENGTEILNTWFAGVYPYDNPEYAIVVMTENGKSGAGDCCPIFRAIVEKL